MLRIYRTRVNSPSWNDPDSRAALLAQLALEERRLIGFDESLTDEGIVLLISVDKERRAEMFRSERPARSLIEEGNDEVLA